MSRRSLITGLAAGWFLAALVGLSPLGLLRLSADEPQGEKEAGVSDSENDLASIPIGLPEPRRFAKRAAVRMRGAIECEAAGYFGGPSDDPKHDHFNLSSLELVGPRAHPSWEVQIQREGNAVSRVIFNRQDAPYMDGIRSVGKPGDKGWSATLADEGRLLKLRAVLQASPGEQPLEFECRVEWPATREPVPVPGEIRALFEKHTGMVARKFSTWEFGRARDRACASVILDTEEQARAALTALRGALPKGWVAFLGSYRWLDNPEIKGVELVVAPGNGWADMLRTARLDPVNSGLTTESVVRWLTEYDRTMGIDVIGVSTDSLDFDLRGGPYYTARFVDDLTHLCGDLLNNSRSDVEEMVESGKISLWWD